MRRFILCLFMFTGSSFVALAGELTVAVVSYSDNREPSEVAAAFAGEDLRALVAEQRIDRGPKPVRGGRVRFTQTVSLSPGSSLSQNIRIGEVLAETRLKLGSSTVEVGITTEEEVNVGLSKVRRESWKGSGAYTAGRIAVLGVKQSSTKTAVVTKNDKGVRVDTYTTFVLAQYVH